MRLYCKLSNRAAQAGGTAPEIQTGLRQMEVPSIDAAKKIADAFEVSMNYLVGEGVNVAFDKKNVKRLQDIEKLDEDVKDKLYFVIDNIIQNSKAKKALAS